MKAFGLPQHLVAPIYQRSYLWKEDDQWAPLWHDLRRLEAEAWLSAVQSFTHAARPRRLTRLLA